MYYESEAERQLTQNRDMRTRSPIWSKKLCRRRGTVEAIQSSSFGKCWKSANPSHTELGMLWSHAVGFCPFLRFESIFFWVAFLLHKHKEYEWPCKSKQKVFPSAMTVIECMGKNMSASPKYFPSLLLILVYGLLELHTVPMHVVILGGFFFHGLVPDPYKYSTCITLFDEEFHRTVTREPSLLWT